MDSDLSRRHPCRAIVAARRSGSVDSGRRYTRRSGGTVACRNAVLTSPNVATQSPSVALWSASIATSARVPTLVAVAANVFMSSLKCLIWEYLTRVFSCFVK
eukprot:6595551-Heterocapsa_arctica.AAC.1